MLYLISYDLVAPGKDYNQLWKALADLGGVRVLESEWIVKHANSNPLLLANYCLHYMDANDRILVTELSSNYAFRGLLAKPLAA